MRLNFSISIVTNFWYFNEKVKSMSKNTSISLGNYFDEFVDNRIKEGRFKNKSEVVRAGLRLLEEEESKVVVLRNAIQEGLSSSRVEDFDFDQNLKELKSEKTKNG